MVKYISFLCGIFVWCFSTATVNSQTSGYPDALVNRHFVDDDGYSWIFSKEFSPSVGTLLYRSIGHRDAFFAEYSFDFTDGAKNIVYKCTKYEISDSSTIFIWAFPKFYKQYNDSIPSLCNLCNGMVQFQIKLIDMESGGSSASNVTMVTVPDISEPKTPSFCDGNVRNRGTVTENVITVLVFTMSRYLYL